VYPPGNCTDIEGPVAWAASHQPRTQSLSVQASMLPSFPACCQLSIPDSAASAWRRHIRKTVSSKVWRCRYTADSICRAHAQNGGGYASGRAQVRRFATPELYEYRLAFSRVSFPGS